MLNFNSNKKSWKVYTNTLTSIANYDLLIKPNNTNDLILEVSANNNIILKKGDISYSINTKFTSIDTSFSNVYTTFSAIDSSFIQVNTKFFIIDASFNNKLASISGSIVPLNDICYNLGSDTNRWANAYMRDISVTNISASGNIVPLFNLSGNLGVSDRMWFNAYIRDLSGLVNINGQPYVTGTNINLTNVTSNINPSIDNNGSLGISSQKWGNAYIRDLSVGSIDVSVNLNPLVTNSGSLGGPLKRWGNAYIRDLSVDSIDISVNLNPLINNNGSLGAFNKIWANAYIRDLSVSNISASGNIIPLFTLSGSLGITSNRWNIAYIKDISNVVNINGQPYISGTGTIDLNNVTTNINPSIDNSGSLGGSLKRWRNAYIRDLSVGSIDVSVNLNPLNITNISLGASNKKWGNAYIRDLSVSSIDVSVNLNPLTSNSISLGASNRRWRNAYIRDLSINFIDASSLVVGNFFLPYFPTSFISRPIKLRIANTSTYNSVDNFGLQVINTTSNINNWSAINVEVRSVATSTNKVGMQLSVRGSDLVARNTWNIFCRDNDANGSLAFLTNSTFNAMSGIATTAFITSAGIYNQNSDDRLKHNEIIITNGLDVIDKLVPKVYQKTQVMLGPHYNGDLSGYKWRYEAGLIAQEILQINDISFAVSGGDIYDSSNNVIPAIYMVAYNHIFIYGLAAIKELDKKVETQESTILSLQTNISSQETTILNQQAIINSLIASIEALKNKV